MTCVSSLRPLGSRDLTAMMGEKIYHSFQVVDHTKF